MKVIHKNRPKKTLFNILIILVLTFAIPNIILSTYIVAIGDGGVISKMMFSLSKNVVKINDSIEKMNTSTYADQIIDKGLNNKYYADVRSDILKDVDKYIDENELDSAEKLITKLVIKDPKDLDAKTRYANIINIKKDLSPEDIVFIKSIKSYYSYDRLLNSYLIFAIKHSTIQDVVDVVNKYRKNYNVNERSAFTIVVFFPDINGQYSNKAGRSVFYRPRKDREGFSSIKVRYSGQHKLRVDIENLMRQMPSAQYEIKVISEGVLDSDIIITYDKYSNVSSLGHDVYETYGDDPKLYVGLKHDDSDEENEYKIMFKRVGDVIPISLKKALNDNEWVFYYRNKNGRFSNSLTHPVAWNVGSNSFMTKINLESECHELRLDFPESFAAKISDISIVSLDNNSSVNFPSKNNTSSIKFSGFNVVDGGVRVSGKDPHIKWNSNGSCNYEIAIK